MLLSFDEVSKKIEDGEILHIAGTENLLRQLPKGDWIGGSTEYFMGLDEGKVSGDMLYVTGFPYTTFKIRAYSVEEIKSVANDAYDNGFSIIIVPFDSPVHKEFAENAAGFENLFMHNMAGWISGLNLGNSGQTPIAVDGPEAEAHKDKAVVLHLEVPEDKTVVMDIVNIFEQDETASVIEFKEEGFSAATCTVDGEETVLADYLEQSGIDIKMPLVGDYYGTGINVSFKSVADGVVNFYAPVFKGIQYRPAKKISDYESAFRSHFEGMNDNGTVFSCNCILNFLYGGLEGKSIGAFAGPVTFGEIAYQLVNQTLVYVKVL